MAVVDTYGGPAHETCFEGLAVMGFAAELSLGATTGAADLSVTGNQRVRIGGEWVEKSTPNEIRQENLAWAEGKGYIRDGRVVVSLANSDN